MATMKDVAQFTDEELQREFDARKEVKKALDKPVMLKGIDWEPVMLSCQTYVDDLSTKGYVDEGYKQFLFELVITACFGNSIWSWVRKVSQ